MNFRTIIEPFRIKSVEAVKFTHREEREARLREAVVALAVVVLGLLLLRLARPRGGRGLGRA